MRTGGMFHDSASLIGGRHQWYDSDSDWRSSDFSDTALVLKMLLLIGCAWSTGCHLSRAPTSSCWRSTKS